MATPVLQQLLKLDGAVGHEVVVADGGIVEDGQLDFAPVAHIGNELVVPGRAVGLLLGGGLADARIVHVEGDVGVEKESLWPGSHCMAQRPGCGLQAHGLADFDLKKAIEHYHGRGGEWGPGSLRPPRRQDDEPTPRRSEPQRLLGPLSPHPALSLHLVALRDAAGDSQRVHVFPRPVPNGKQGGGESWGTSVFGASLSPPTTSSTSRRGAVGSAASREGCLAASLALRVRAAGKRAPRPALTYLSET